MTQVHMLREMYLLTKKHDFIIILSSEYNPIDWGYYYPDNRTIVIYTLDENGKEIDETSLIRIACHEVAHHIQHHHMKDYEIQSGNEHDDTFKELFAKLLIKYYNGDIPVETLEIIKEEKLSHELFSQKERGYTRAPKVSRRVVY